MDQRLMATNMFMVTFTGFIVISNYAMILFNIGQPIFERIIAPTHRLRKSPNH